MFNLYLKKKHNVGKLTKYDHALLASFFEFRGFYFSLCMLVKKKMRWPIGGNFELPTWFITVLKILCKIFFCRLLTVIVAHPVELLTY
jgi:hypothetical protein